jgi:hypothetical protein
VVLPSSLLFIFLLLIFYIRSDDPSRRDRPARQTGLARASDGTTAGSRVKLAEDADVIETGGYRLRR